MGKSGKKLKSDKINALRKQYDAFLEEDKQRKDRNEFILGRLENMRFSNAAPVPAHHQKIPLMRNYYTSPQKPYISKSEFCVDHNRLQGEKSIPLSTYNRNFEETSILKEISKKYILIPKLQSTFESDTDFADSPMKTITDTDWKNKYNILDELKKNEKETTQDNDSKLTDLDEVNKNMPYIDLPLNTLHNENPLLDTNWKIEHERYQSLVYNEKMDQVETKISLNKSPENKDIVHNNAEYVKGPIKDIKSSELNFEPNIRETQLRETMYDSKDTRNEDNLIDNTVIKFTTDEQEQITETKENKDYLQEKDHQHLINESKQEIKQVPVSGAQGDENLNMYTHINSNEIYEGEIIREKPESDKTNQKINDDNIGIIELTQEKDEKHGSTDIIMNNTEEYKVGEDHFESNKQYNADAVDNHMSNVVDEVYTNGNEDYEYNEVHNGSVAYAKENEGYMNVDKQIDNEPETYITEKEDYAYYNEPHQEPYTGQINEHEESSDRYDPNYEQQYTNNYDDPNMAQYQSQEYEVGNTYEQQDTNNVIYENQNAGNVNYENDNTETISAVDQPQQENIYNYENEVPDNQQYGSNVQQEYSEIQNDQYGHQQEYNESEMMENMEKQLDADSGLTQNVIGSVNDTVNIVGNTEDTPENVQSEVTLS